MSSFEVIFKENYPGLLLYAKKMTLDEAAAEDIVQEVFFSLWQKRKSLDIRTSLKSYLFSAVLNGCRNRMRHLKVVDQHRQSTEKAQLISVINGYDQLVHQEVSKTIDNTIDNLRANTREIFLLSRFEGLKYKEIAETLNISVKTVEKHIGIALKSLRKNLQGHHIIKEIALLTIFYF